MRTAQFESATGVASDDEDRQIGVQIAQPTGELEELAADSGAAEVPGSGSNQVVARLDAASDVKRGQQAELWLDTAKLHFFDPQSGRRLGADQR